MERHLHSVRREEGIPITTLRRVAGELYDANAVDYFLQQRMAQLALFISAAMVYEIDEDHAVARTLSDLTGGFIAYYDELQELLVIRAPLRVARSAWWKIGGLWRVLCLKMLLSTAKNACDVVKQLLVFCHRGLGLILTKKLKLGRLVERCDLR